MPLFFSLHLFGLSHSLPYHFIACPRLNRYVTQTWIILIFKKKKKNKVCINIFFLYCPLFYLPFALSLPKGFELYFYSASSLISNCFSISCSLSCDPVINLISLCLSFVLFPSLSLCNEKVGGTVTYVYIYSYWGTVEWWMATSLED